MEIPLIVVLIIAEVLLVLFGLSITFGILLLRKPKKIISEENNSEKQTKEKLDAIDLGNSYIEFIEQEMQRNENKTKQQESIEEDIASDNEESPESSPTSSPESSSENDDEEIENNESPAPTESQSHLLKAREQFLLIEKSAAENTEHDIKFWETIYDGMKTLLEQFSSSETKTITPETTEGTSTESKEKVFYIETQGKKIDGEVNKLKDIIYEQENALSSMKKTMQDAEQEHPEESESLALLKEQIETIERQLNDSKMCMEVLEMENNRLQEEVDNIDARHNAILEEEKNNSAEESDSLIDLDQMKEVVEQQENKIQQLIDTIENLEIDATQAEKLKETIGEFARTSKEMMGCISILEEENERLKDGEESVSESSSLSESTEDIDALKQNISVLEEDLIKKDVAYAKLQDEFSSMETEYLAMYEAMHGDNSK